MNKGSSPRTPARRVQAFEAPHDDELSFTVELWNLAKDKRERLIARCSSLEVANTIYSTAVADHPFRRIVLRQGRRIIRATS